MKKKLIYKYAKSPTEYSIYKLLSKFMTQNLPLQSQICDVGCGSGRYSNFLYEMGYTHIIGIDPSPYVKFIQNKNIKFINQSLECFVKSHKKLFDLVICIDVIEHIEDDKNFFYNLSALLKKNGWLLLVTPANPSLFSYRDLLYGHYRRYTKSQIESLFYNEYSNLQIKTIGWSIFLRIASLFSNFHRKANFHLKEQTNQSFEFKPPFIYWKVNTFLKIFYDIFYLIDILFSDTNKGCEFFITAQKR